jgi:hypothetical protein
MFVDTGVSMRQMCASHTSARYNLYVRPCRITGIFLAVLCHFWHSIFTRKICHHLQGYFEFEQYSLRSGIFFQKKLG